MPPTPTIQRSAQFLSPEIRIKLTREWADGPRALVIGCNPSEASDVKDDPTSHWWNLWFQAHGFGAFDAMNLYPKISADPAICASWAKQRTTAKGCPIAAIMAENLIALQQAAQRCDRIFVCWGNLPWDQTWTKDVIAVLRQDGETTRDIWCWKRNKDGSPRHPAARGRHRIPLESEAVVWLPA